MYTSDLIIASYGKFVATTMDNGWEGYLLTFMFAPLKGSQKAVLHQMEDEIERVYATMLTRLVRNPHSRQWADKLPIWLACPDFPIRKTARHQLRFVSANDGLHVHAICLIPPKTRLRQDLTNHVKANQGLYVQDERVLQRLHAKSIDFDPEYVIGYAFKSIHNRRVHWDELIVLPRSTKELVRSKHQWDEDEERWG